MEIQANKLFPNHLQVQKDLPWEKYTSHLGKNITHLQATTFCLNNFFYWKTYIKALKSKTHTSLIFPYFYGQNS